MENNSRAYNTMIHVYQGVTSREIDDTVKKVKLNNDLKKRKILT